MSTMPAYDRAFSDGIKKISSRITECARLASVTETMFDLHVFDRLQPSGEGVKSVELFGQMDDDLSSLLSLMRRITTEIDELSPTRIMRRAKPLKPRESTMTCARSDVSRSAANDVSDLLCDIEALFEAVFLMAGGLGAHKDERHAFQLVAEQGQDRAAKAKALLGAADGLV